MNAEKLADGARRKSLLKGAAVAVAGALAGPAIVRAQGVTLFRFQSTWPSRDIFHEMALDFAKRVNDMTGGELKIDVLPAGAVVPAFNLFEAVSSGTLDGGHGILGYHYNKQSALALWNSGPAFGMDSNMLLAWHKYGGGKELLEKLYSSIGGNLVSFLSGPFPTQPLGWFKKPVTKPEDFKGLKYRTSGLATDLFNGMGATVNSVPAGEIVSAMDRGMLDAAEYVNATSDRILGLSKVSKICMLQSFHQTAECFEITFNKTKYEALNPKIRAVISNAAEAASADMSWKGIDRYSKDYLEMKSVDKVQFYKTPESVLRAQLKVWDRLVEQKSAQNPLFKEIVASQSAFAKRAVQWEQDTVIDRRLAMNHFFGKGGSSKPS